jgi:hypothetical protein
MIAGHAPRALRSALSNCHRLEHPQVYASLQDPKPEVEHLSRWMCLIMSLKSKVPLLFILYTVRHPSHLGPNLKASQITTIRLREVRVIILIRILLQCLRSRLHHHRPATLIVP